MSFCHPQPSAQCFVPCIPTCPPHMPITPMCPPLMPHWGGAGVYPVPVVNPYPQHFMGGCPVPPGPWCPPPPGHHCVTVCWPR